MAGECHVAARVSRHHASPSGLAIIRWQLAAVSGARCCAQPPVSKIIQQSRIAPKKVASFIHFDVGRARPHEMGLFSSCRHHISNEGRRQNDAIAPAGAESGASGDRGVINPTTISVTVVNGKNTHQGVEQAMTMSRQVVSVSRLRPRSSERVIVFDKLPAIGTREEAAPMN